MHNWVNRMWLGRLGMAAVVATAVVTPHRAHALDGCHGTYSASSLDALPSPLILQLGTGTDDPEQAATARVFQAGMQQAGANFSGSPTLQINGVASVTPRAAPASSPQQPTSAGFAWVDTAPGSTAVEGATIVLTLSALNLATSSLVWTGSVTCVATTDDKPALARSLGALVFSTLGQAINNRPL